MTLNLQHGSRRPYPLGLITCAMLLLSVFACAKEPATALDVNFRTFLWYYPPQLITQNTVTTKSARASETPDLLAPEISYISSDNAPETIELPEKRLSAVHHYRAKTPLIFGTVIPPRKPDEQPRLAEQARVNLPPNASDVILFFFPDTNAADAKYHVMPVPASPRDIPAGSALVMNLTAVQINLKIGSTQLVMNPMGMQRITIDGTQNGLLPLMLQAKDEEDIWRRKLQRRLLIQPDSSSIIAFYQSNKFFHCEMILTNPEETLKTKR